jgi:penicillin-binding protein 1B
VKGGIEITPGDESYHSPEPARIDIEEGQISRITSRGNELSAYELEPQLVTALFDAEQRSKRQVVKYNDIPPVMVQAVLAIEDRRFFEHSGVNFVRTFEAVWEDRATPEKGAGRIHDHAAVGARILSDSREVDQAQGDRDADRRGVGAEIFTKQQIFEFYANWVDLGQRGSFAISGFAEASKAYFGKDLEGHLRCPKRRCSRD